MRVFRWAALVGAMSVLVPTIAKATESTSDPVPEIAAPGEAVTSVPVVIYNTSTGSASSGLLVNGSLQIKKTYAFEAGWSLALSRTSALWHKAGFIAYGTMTGGVYVQKGFKAFTGDFSQIVASCDTVALYNSLTGELRTATLNNGAPGPWTTTFVAPSARLNATCDSLIVSATDRPTQRAVTVGTLKAGKWASKQEAPLPPYQYSGTTSDSVLFAGPLASNEPRPSAGRVAGGIYTATRFVTLAFNNRYLQLAGGGNTMVLYESGGGGGRTARLVNGVLTDVGPVSVTAGSLIYAGK